MAYPTRLSDAIHILLYVHVNAGDDLSSAAIADSVSTHPSYVRQLMSALRKGGLLDCSRGQATPTLTRSVGGISLLDVYRAVEGGRPLLHRDADTNPECSMGMCIQTAVRSCFDEIQEAAERAMASISLEDVMARFRCEGECHCDPRRCPCGGRCGSPTCGAPAGGGAAGHAAPASCCGAADATGCAGAARTAGRQGGPDTADPPGVADGTAAADAADVMDAASPDVADGTNTTKTMTPAGETPADGRA